MPGVVGVVGAVGDVLEEPQHPFARVDLHGWRLDVGDVGAVLLRVPRELDRLLDGVRARAEAHDPHDVPREAAGQRDDVLGPLVQRQ